MLYKLRENTHAIMWVVVVAFVFTMVFMGMFVGGRVTVWDRIVELVTGSSGTGDASVIGMVNGTSINRDMFVREYSNNLEQQRDSEGNIAFSSRKRISDQTWDNNVKRILYAKEAEKLGILITDEEVAYLLRNNPPAAIKNIFTVDGKFEPELLDSLLGEPSWHLWNSIFPYLKETLLYQRVNEVIHASVQVSEMEIRDQFVKQNVEYKIEFLEFKNRNIKDDEIEITDEDRKTFWSEHKEDYFQQEKRVMDYAFFSLDPSPIDSAEVLIAVNDILHQIQNGADFAEFANLYSEDESNAEKGGDLGWFGKGVMAREFEDAAFAAKKGEIVGPVSTQFGYHLIHVRDKKKVDESDEIQASHILLKIMTTPRTLEDARNNSSIFQYLALESGFQSAAEEIGVEIKTTNPMKRTDTYLREPGNVPMATKFAFESQVGEVSEVLGSENGYAIFTLKEIQAEHYQPVEDVSSRIDRRLKITRRADIAEERLKKLQLPDGADFKRFATETENVEFGETDEPFTLDKSIPEVGLHHNLNGILAAMEVGEVSSTISTSRGAFIIRLLSKSELDEKAYEEEKIEKSLLNQKKNQAMTDWYNAVKEDAKIIDKRLEMLNL